MYIKKSRQKKKTQANKMESILCWTTTFGKGVCHGFVFTCPMTFFTINWLSLLNTYQLQIAFVLRDGCLEYFSIAVTKQTKNKIKYVI